MAGRRSQLRRVVLAVAATGVATAAIALGGGRARARPAHGDEADGQYKDGGKDRQLHTMTFTRRSSGATCLRARQYR